MGKKIIATIVASVIAIAIASGLCGCSGGVSSLNKDASLETDWGTVLQYKVNSNWEESDSASSDSLASVYYTDKNTKESIFISIDDADNLTYKYSSDSTYSDWIKNSEETYTRSAQDQADWYKKNMTGQNYKEEYADPDMYPSYSNYSLDEVGQKDVSGCTFRIYKRSYTVTFSDSYIERAKEKNPDIQKTTDSTSYCAILKDGSHDMEITASSEALLNSFLSTLSIKW